MTESPKPLGRASPATPAPPATEIDHVWSTRVRPSVSGGAGAIVVLGVDDDDKVESLVDRTVELAIERRASVLVLHVVHRSEVWVLASLMVDSRRYIQARRRHLERRAVTRLRDRGIDARIIVRLGEPAHQLARLSATCGAELIVIGSETHERKHHLVGGGVAHRLAQLTAVPVEVVAPVVLGAAASQGHHGR